MMEENFRRIADTVRLPEGSRARIRAPNGAPPQSG